jgi:uncharacterized protein YidB (DUF937 family)
MALQDTLSQLGGAQGKEGGLDTIHTLFGNKGLQGITTQLSDKGMGDQVQSWVGRGDNEPVSGTQVQQAVDPAKLQQVAQHTGMSPEEVSDHVAQALPQIVDQATPDGQMPSQDPLATKNPSLLKRLLKI